jgi:hypothetical protein
MKNNHDSSRSVIPLPRTLGRWSTGWLVIGACLACGASFSAAGAEDERAIFQKLIAERSQAVVSIKLVLKMKGAFFGPEGQEYEQDTSGLMIDPHGIVLASSNEMGGVPPALKQMLGQMGELSIEPQNIKVVIGTDPTEFDAEIITRDSDLDLAWLRIKTTDDKRFTALDLSDSTDCRLGQKLVMVDRMNKYFDRAPVVEEFRIAGITTKPRRLYVPNTELGSGYCAPIFTMDGKFIGVKILQIPESDASPDNPFAAMAQMGDLQSMMTGFILPAETIRQATQRATTASQPAAAPKE